jgi:hypothetical protein
MKKENKENKENKERYYVILSVLSSFAYRGALNPEGHNLFFSLISNASLVTSIENDVEEILIKGMRAVEEESKEKDIIVLYYSLLMFEQKLRSPILLGMVIYLTKKIEKLKFNPLLMFYCMKASLGLKAICYEDSLLFFSLSFILFLA